MTDIVIRKCSRCGVRPRKYGSYCGPCRRDYDAERRDRDRNVILELTRQKVGLKDALCRAALIGDDDQVAKLAANLIVHLRKSGLDLEGCEHPRGTPLIDSGTGSERFEGIGAEEEYAPNAVVRLGPPSQPLEGGSTTADGRKPTWADYGIEVDGE